MTRTSISQADLAKKIQEVVGRVPSQPDVEALQAYLAEEISLGKTADLLGLSRFELQDRFFRLGVPLFLGPATIEEARAEVATALGITPFGRS